MLPKHERWRTDYRRNPYLRSLDRAALRDRFDEVMLAATLPMLVNTPLKLRPEAAQLAMECFTHMMVEMGDRAIPITEFQHTSDRAAAAAVRLELAPHIIEWVKKHI